MGHLVGKDVYRNLGKKIDSLNVRVPWNETFHAILKELYTTEEADIVARMPSGLSTAADLSRFLKIEPVRLQNILETLCGKGLVVDLFVNGNYYYIPSPLVVGIFEFTMMRMDTNIDIKKIARLFHQYMNDETFYAANFDKSMGAMGIMRTLPYEESFPGAPGDDAYVEVLDYEKATAIVENADLFSVGHCSCRHEMDHAGRRNCETPLNTCTSFGYSADYLIRNNLAAKSSKTEMLELIARSKEMGLMLNADTVKSNSQFICHCCKCCCHVLQGVTTFGYPDIIVTSSYMVQSEPEKCTGCGACARACGVEAIEMVPLLKEGESLPAGEDAQLSKCRWKTIKIDESLCVGCGICVTKCNFGALHMDKRKQRVLHPESTFEKAIIKSIQKGNLQEQLFTDPHRISQKFLRGVLGGFLRLNPVKRALMSDMLRSRFFNLLRKGATMQGKGWLTEL